MSVDCLKLGRIGELLAAVVLEQGGYSATIVGGNKYDILATTNDDVFRVQVKSTLRPTDEKGRKKNSYVFRTGHGRSSKHAYEKGAIDMYALVALDIRRVLFVPSQDIQVVTKRIKPECFVAEDAELNSLVETVKKLEG